MGLYSRGLRPIALYDPEQRLFRDRRALHLNCGGPVLDQHLLGRNVAMSPQGCLNVMPDIQCKLAMVTVEIGSGKHDREDRKLNVYFLVSHPRFLAR